MSTSANKLPNTFTILLRPLVASCAIFLVSALLFRKFPNLLSSIPDEIQKLPTWVVIGALVCSLAFAVYVYCSNKQKSRNSATNITPSAGMKELNPEQVAAIMNVFAAVSQNVKTHIEDNSSFVSSMGEINNKLSTTLSQSALESIVAEIVNNTLSISEKATSFENKLKASEQKIELLTKKIDRVEQESLTDPLTLVANRRHFEMELREKIEIYRVNAKPLSFALLDIDHFKSINDRFGHQVGDQVLRIFAKTIQRNVRDGDFLARYGGEEFGIILPGANIKQAIELQNRILTKLRTKNWVLKDQNDKIGTITASIGVSEFVKHDTVETLVERADTALYRAKNEGRNRVLSSAVESNASRGNS